MEALKKLFEKDVLRPLTNKETVELLELYKSKYGESNFHYLFVYNQRKWDKKLEELKDPEETKKWLNLRKVFYTYRERDFRMYGTYISLHYDEKQSISFHSWQPTGADLFLCLSETNRIDWRAGPLLINVDLTFTERVKKLAVEKGGKVENVHTHYGMVLPREVALNLEAPAVPAGYKVDVLPEKSADLVHSMWVNNNEGSLQYVRCSIALNPTVGVYRESDNQLVAWIVPNDFSGLGVLHVLPEVKEMQLNKLLATYMSKEIANDDQVNVSAWIVMENAKTEELLQKVGYKIAVIKEWIQLADVRSSRAELPPNPNENKESPELQESQKPQETQDPREPQNPQEPEKPQEFQEPQEPQQSQAPLTSH